MTKRTQAIVGLSGVFLLGAFCGALVFGVVMRDRAREAVGLRSREGFIHHFERRLQLTEAQRDSLKDELERTYSQMTALREETSQRYNTLIDTLAVRIMPTLTEEQRELFRDQEQRFRRFLPKEKKGPRPHPRAGEMPPSSALQPAGTPMPLATRSTVAPKLPPKTPDVPAVASVSPSITTAIRPADSAGVTLKNCAARQVPPQPTGENVPFMEAELKRVQSRLGLSDEQTASFRKIMADTRATIKQIKTDEAGRPIVKRRRVGETMRQMDEQIMSMLTGDQQSRWIAMREEIAEKMKQKRRQKQREPILGGG